MDNQDAGAKNRRRPANGAAAAARSRSKRPLRGGLLKAIDLGEAKPRGLRASLALAPDETDVRAHLEDELRARAAELIEFLGLPREGWDLEQLAKALIEREFGIPRGAQNWWERFAACLIQKYVPGFSLIKVNKKKHGAPLEWTPERLMQLFADVEFFKRKGLSVAAICKFLPTKQGYRERWAAWADQDRALSRAYYRAHELCQKDWLFLVELCGGEALIPERRGDLIEKAIERHALKL
jgi:hypothetical protein